MIKLIIFDLDGTVAKIGTAATEYVSAKLREFENKGIKVAFSSGKPTYYLCGFARQMGLIEPILIGENGAMIQYGIALPPKKQVTQFIPEKVKITLSEIRKALEKKFPDRIWYQPNVTSLTPFFYYPSEAPAIEKEILSHIEKDSEIRCISHIDCFDVMYDKLSKGKGLESLSEITGITRDEMISVGDWTNDYPMFEYTAVSIGINIPDKSKATYDFPSIEQALDFICKNYL